MLMVTSSVGMLHRVHSNTTNLQTKYKLLSLIFGTNNQCARGEIPNLKWKLKIEFEDLDFSRIFIYQNDIRLLKLGVRKMHAD